MQGRLREVEVKLETLTGAKGAHYQPPSPRKPPICGGVHHRSSGLGLSELMRMLGSARLTGRVCGGSHLGDATPLSCILEGNVLF